MADPLPFWRKGTVYSSFPSRLWHRVPRHWEWSLQASTRSWDLEACQTYWKTHFRRVLSYCSWCYRNSRMNPVSQMQNTGGDGIWTNFYSFTCTSRPLTGHEAVLASSRKTLSSHKLSPNCMICSRSYQLGFKFRLFSSARPTKTSSFHPNP